MERKAVRGISQMWSWDENLAHCVEKLFFRRNIKVLVQICSVYVVLEIPRKALHILRIWSELCTSILSVPVELNRMLLDYSEIGKRLEWEA